MKNLTVADLAPHKRTKRDSVLYVLFKLQTQRSKVRRYMRGESFTIDQIMAQYVDEFGAQVSRDTVYSALTSLTKNTNFVNYSFTCGRNIYWLSRSMVDEAGKYLFENNYKRDYLSFDPIRLRRDLRDKQWANVLAAAYFQMHLSPTLYIPSLATDFSILDIYHAMSTIEDEFDDVLDAVTTYTCDEIHKALSNYCTRKGYVRSTHNESRGDSYSDFDNLTFELVLTKEKLESLLFERSEKSYLTIIQEENKQADSPCITFVESPEPESDHEPGAEPVNNETLNVPVASDAVKEAVRKAEEKDEILRDYVRSLARQLGLKCVDLDDANDNM